MADGEWYLHLFAPEQPDLDWTNPEVPAEFERIIRFWLDRGVDGFRIDVGHGMAKPPGLPDMDLTDARAGRTAGALPVARTICAGTRTACTSTTAGSGGCSTPTRATGWRSARCGSPTTSGWRATSARTS